MEKSKLWKALGIFFGAMVLFTLLSRAAYQRGTAVVRTAAPTGGTIDHSVSLHGKTVQKQVIPVTTQPGLRIASVPVSEGQQVKAGEVLFCLDMDYLDEKIEQQKQEMQKQKLSIQDAWSQNSVQAQRHAVARAQAEENYDAAVSDAEQKRDLAEIALDHARQQLANYDSSAPADSEERQALEESLAQAETALEQAQSELESATRIYGQALETASLPESSGSSAQIGQITYAQMDAQLEKLAALWDSGGEVLAPADGVVTAAYVSTGQLTSETAAFLLADSSQGWLFTAEVTQEQSKYIGTGDKVQLRLESSGKEYTNLPVVAFSSKDDGGTLTVELPAADVPLGAGMELRFTKKSQAYRCCVPLSALHLDAQNRAYVLTLEEVDTVLGKQTRAAKVAVTVLDNNETTAALEAGGLGDKEVIVSSDRTVDSGSRVRVE